MKKLSLFVLMLFAAPAAWAGTTSIDYPDGQAIRIREALTDNGAACNAGENLTVCAKRLLAAKVRDIVRTYEISKARAASDATVGFTDIS